MTQYARPTSDTAAGSWTDEGAVDNDGNLYTSLDEVTIDDDDSYIQGSNGAGTCVVQLGSIDTPSDPTTCTVYIWFRSIGSGAGEKTDFALIEDYGGGGQATRGTWANKSNRSASYANGAGAIDLSAVTDWSNLYIEIAEDTIGSGEYVRVTQVYLEAPDGSSPQAVSPTGLDSGIGLVGPTLTSTAKTVAPAGLKSGVGHGEPTIVSAAQTVEPAGLKSGIGLAEPAVSLGTALVVAPTGFKSGVGLGEPTITLDTAIIVTPGELKSGVGYGPLTVVLAGAAGQTVEPTGLKSGVGLGEPTLAASALAVQPTGLKSGVGLGEPTIISTTLTIQPVGFKSGIGLAGPGFRKIRAREPVLVDFIFTHGAGFRDWTCGAHTCPRFSTRAYPHRPKIRHWCCWPVNHKNYCGNTRGPKVRHWACGADH